MNTMNKRKSPILPMGVSQPESPDSHNTRIAAIRIHALGRKRERASGCGRNRTANARIRAVFAVTDPIALPAAISACPDSAAITDTKISGKVVATETMVAPMMNGGIPDADAIQAAASTKRSPPRIMQNNPSANSRNTKNVLMKSPQIHIILILNKNLYHLLRYISYSIVGLLDRRQPVCVSRRAIRNISLISD